MSAVRSRDVRRLVVVGALVIVGSTACTAADTARDSAAAADTAGRAAVAGSTAAAAPALWYDRTRQMDLTGDGQLDIVRLTARGVRADSMQLQLVFVVDGVEKHREEWGSGYELALLDSAVRHDTQMESLLRVRLDSVLASVVVEPLEGRTLGLMAEDSVILEGVSPWPKERVIFSYGFESQPNLFWDAPRGRFVRLWSCC